MKLFFHKNFNKGYYKLPASTRARCDQRLLLFLKDPFDALLNNHPLQAEFAGYRSINITGNIRALYRNISTDSVQFVKIGTHHELFGT